ncbi:MAG: hypothetical protein GYB68_08235 [Chloroflexi bacterium]|nr:hypothetical protein [Chloroflexota bacterium]
MKRLNSSGLLLVLLAVLAACSPADPEPSTPPTATAAATLAASQDEITPIPTPTLTASPIPTPSWDSLTTLAYTEQVTYRLPPTIRHVTETSATLLFEFDEAVSGRLVYRSVDNQMIRTLDFEQAERHLINLEGLQPDQRYEVSIALEQDGDLYAATFLGEFWPLTFRTPDGAGEIRFGVIGDASFGDDSTVALIQQMAAADLNFALHTGDVVDETDPEANPIGSYQQKFYTPFAPLLHQMPVYTVPGNHDYDRDSRFQDAPFYYYAFAAFDEPRIPAGIGIEGPNQFYAFGYGDVQFLMLDSQVFFGVQGREEQAAWMAERLADEQFRATIPVFHVSPYSSSSVHPTDGLPIRLTWPPLFAAAATNVPLVFSGHFHHYERNLTDGTTYIVTGGGSSTLYVPGDPLPGSQLYVRRTHYVDVTLSSDKIDLVAIALGGEILDEISIPLTD